MIRYTPEQTAAGARALTDHIYGPGAWEKCAPEVQQINCQAFAAGLATLPDHTAEQQCLCLICGEPGIGTPNHKPWCESTGKTYARDPALSDASSNGRTPPFEGVNAGSTPAASTNPKQGAREVDDLLAGQKLAEHVQRLITSCIMFGPPGYFDTAKFSHEWLSWHGQQLAAKGAEIERLKAEKIILAARSFGDEMDAIDYKAAISKLTEALRGVIKEADRKTDAFDRAHAAIAKAEQLIEIAPPASANRQCPASPDKPGHR